MSVLFYLAQNEARNPEKSTRFVVSFNARAEFDSGTIGWLEMISNRVQTA